VRRDGLKTTSAHFPSGDQMNYPQTVAKAAKESLAEIKVAQPITLPPDHPALAGNGLTSPTVTSLCQYWPIARPVILSLTHFLPAWTHWIVNILISVGDGACPQ
jgi:hypothetical protein